MEVYKFGGASVKDAGGVENLRKIVADHKGNLVVVVSALGKTTNALENLHRVWREDKEGFVRGLGKLVEDHLELAALLGMSDNSYGRYVSGMIHSSCSGLEEKKRGTFDHDYDMIVSLGEIWSTVIVEAYLRSKGLRTKWIDIREQFVTSDRHREAEIMWERTEERVKSSFTFDGTDICVTQGFIGATPDGDATTLGREGSDYTAAILANILDAARVVVWKDVPGVMNADPAWLPDAVTLRHISYNEAVEMTFSGARVIHPKTIKPLHNKKIPMYVRSFIDLMHPGTLISDEAPSGEMAPVFVRKEGQILISLLPRDLSFVLGDNLSSLFHLLAEMGVRVNLVQTGAVSINICADHEEPKISEVLKKLGEEYSILYNDCAEMITVRHSVPGAAESVTRGREILLTQRTRNTERMVVRNRES